MNASLPVLLKPRPGRVLLVGAGAVGYHKASVLERNGIAATVVAEKVDGRFAGLHLHTLLCRRLRPTDYEAVDIVIDATGDDEVTQTLLEAKKTCGFCLNVVDVPELCDFYFSSLLYYGAVKIAVSSEGASPTLTQCVREKIRRTLPVGLEALAERKAAERATGRIDIEATRREADRLLSQVYLVGCGIGDAELLTLKAYRIIREADVVLYDHLISDAILELVPATTEAVFVGKRKGCHSHTQEAINALIAAYADRGLCVARLKSGDPYIFGRGAEEALFLSERGYRVEVVPGISSAVAGPASAGIPATARGYAAGFSVVSAHLKGNRVNLEWIDLLKLPNHTTTVLMGLSLAGAIREVALASGVDPELDAAIVSNASRPNQRTLITTLEALETAAVSAEGPAVIVFGKAVRLCGQLPSYERENGEKKCRPAA